MPFAYFDRLSPARQRIYLRSDAIERVELPAGPSLEVLVGDLERMLAHASGIIGFPRTLLRWRRRCALHNQRHETASSLRRT